MNLYSGCGNIFIIVDQAPDRCLIPDLCKLSDPQADGVISHSGTDPVQMRIFNSDGGEAEMCGNGVRCLAQYLKDQGLTQRRLAIQTMAGRRDVLFTSSGIQVSMGAVQDLRWHLSIDTADGPITAHHLNTGVPHLVLEVSSLEAIDVDKIGSWLRKHPSFQPAGANVNFFQRLDKHRIAVRTYERGVEGETAACGTGATASALTVAHLYRWQQPVEVTVRSGDVLEIGYDPDFRTVTMTGKAEQIGTALPITG